MTNSRTGWPIYGALVLLVDKADVTKQYYATTDEFGRYQIDGIPKNDRIYHITVRPTMETNRYDNYEEDFNAPTTLPEIVEKNFVLEPNVICPPCPSSCPACHRP